MYDQQQYLLDLIKEAFAGVKLGNGVSIHQTEVIDNYGSGKELQEARKKDRIVDDWTQLIDDAAFADVYGIGGYHFLDDLGKCYYLPVYLSQLVMDHKNCPEDCRSVIFSLGQIERAKECTFLSDMQRKCIRQVLTWLIHNTGTWFEFERKHIQRAIDQVWSKPFGVRPAN